MHSEHGSELAAGWNAISGTEVACMHKRAKLITQLDIEGNMTFRLKMYGQHCLSQSANDSTYWTDARANMSFRVLPHSAQKKETMENGSVLGLRNGFGRGV